MRKSLSSKQKKYINTTDTSQNEAKESEDEDIEDKASTSEQDSAHFDSTGGRANNDSKRTEPPGDNAKVTPDLFSQDEDGDTYLHIAVVQCNESLVNFLIQAMKTKTIDIFNNLRQTPLHLAVITGQQNLIKLLVKAGCDINCMDRNGQTPLHLACQRSDVESTHAIFESASTCNKEIAIDIKNFDGLSPLHLATISGNKDVIGLVIDKGANINNKDTTSGRTPLHHAVEVGKSHVVEYLLSRGASANSTTYSGNTPLHTAAGRHMQDMIQLLSRHGADVNLVNMEGDRPKIISGSKQGQRQFESSRKRPKDFKSTSSGKASKKPKH